MTDAEKIAAFDLLAKAMTNKWSDGKWSWWCRTPMGGESRETREEAVQDLIEWAKRPSNQRIREIENQKKRDRAASEMIQQRVENGTAGIGAQV